MCTIGAPEDADYREREVVCMVERRRCGNIRPHDNTSSVMKSGGLVGNAEGEFRQVPLARAISRQSRIHGSNATQEARPSGPSRLDKNAAPAGNDMIR